MKTAKQLMTLAERCREVVRTPENRATNDTPWFRVENADGGDEDRAELFIYGAIGDFWGDDDVTPAAFVRALRGITASTIDLHLNSPGGYVFDGVAIHAALLNHAATVEVHIDGLAASAASFVAMAGDTISIEKPAKMMIHDARGITIGNAEAHTDAAAILNELSDTIAGIYADRAGGTVESWREAMRAETWYSAQGAVDAGLADQVANDQSAADAAQDKIPAGAKIGRAHV